MKWRQIGPGKVQLRLCIAILGDTAYLCHAFVKTSPKKDFREGAKLETRIGLIKKGHFVEKAELKRKGASDGR